MARNILIFSDGTGQMGGLSLNERRSNIYKLYRATRVGPDSCIDPAEQAAYYDAGLGSRPPEGGFFRTVYRMAHNLVSRATGYGLTTNIVDCYSMIIQLWRPGDRIFLFGFSRGAYTVRCLGGVLAHCGIPTRLEDGAPMKYDEVTARRLAKKAVKEVYRYTASVPDEQATPKQKALLDRRATLAREFREAHDARRSDDSDSPNFIGVFDTVASIASWGSIAVCGILFLVLAGVLALPFWALFPMYSTWLWGMVGALFNFIFSTMCMDIAHFYSWIIFEILLSVVVALAKLSWDGFRVVPRGKGLWPIVHCSLKPMRFEDKSLGDDVRYARHAISIDENRKAFGNVPWGDPTASRPDKDAQGVPTFQQCWFAGNHSDIGGSYPENESRLSDMAMAWMVEAAIGIENGIHVDHSVLRLYPSADGMQHDECKGGGIPWASKARTIPNPSVVLHDSVYQRFRLPAVLHFDVMAPYRPGTLRGHAGVSEYYEGTHKAD